MLLVLASFYFSACKSSSDSNEKSTRSFLNSNQNVESSAELEKYRNEIFIALKSSPPVLNKLKLDIAQTKAVELALHDRDFTRHAIDEATNKPCRNEIFTVREVSTNDLGAHKSSCNEASCYRIEMYNFTKNLTSIAILSLQKNLILNVQHNFEMQPEIPKHLQDVALSIATNSSIVKDALGIRPEKRDFIMSSTKTALNETRCERSRHLCVAPTFVLGKQALWSIVDLTDERVVGVRWTHWDDEPITEGRLEDEVITRELCNKSTSINRAGWSFSYGLTGSDGVVVKNLSFNNEPVLKSAKNVDWHVSYSGLEGFGYSDAIGCPLFSTAAVIPAELPHIFDLDHGGFELVQTFKSKRWPLPCNYSYEQRFQLHSDGSFRIVVGNLGRGCGADGTYRPVIRIALPFSIFEEWNGEKWVNWFVEGWRLQGEGTLITKDGYQYRVRDENGRGYYIEPGRGQFNDGGRGDHAFAYVTKLHNDLDEGESDLLTIGPCCNMDEKQGPERYLNGENLDSDGLVFWYVPQLKNDGDLGKEYCWATVGIVDGKEVVKQYPCYAGPRFVPLEHRLN